MQPKGETTCEGPLTWSWPLRALAWVAPASRPFLLRAMTMSLICSFSNAHPLSAQPPETQSLPGPIGPEILSAPALLRPPQEFSGLPSVFNDDPFAAPLLWPVDPPLGY